jgi:hypothetical protein
MTFKIVTSTFFLHSLFISEMVWPMWRPVTIRLVSGTNTMLNTVKACNHFIEASHQMIR